MIVEIDNVEYFFGKNKILSGIYIKGETGTVTGILGKNGCGKTSLLKILFGNLSPKSKNIRIDGKHQKKALFSTCLIAYLPQHSLIPKNLTTSRIFNLFKVSWIDFVAEFDTFSLYEKTKINKLSSGEIRVIETYLILKSRKKIILLDEPFSFISPIHIEKIKNIINTQKKESVIIITDHYYNDILEISDTLFFFKNGYSKPIDSKEDLKNEGYI
ncbi:ATP-binding cassette domain-containing protein [Cellulophaga sp. 20_2_10]|uniref:ATP-binding cassette domain-containing protein n=1 Tax=Cellulophaga sp. 20_2_10 TaxID=2942476 RepID=UPI00201A7115|nr:ATP-binding cassette domain-containing protein [Cellulophaga sp. 20_2_10]MCL5246954.1 ATP-binding cassette domain-containing protein [Cellulophaga sp. 20_2_10]